MGRQAVDLYHRMPLNLRTDITYISVLNACSHAGVIGDAYSIFKSVSRTTTKMITAMVCPPYFCFFFNQKEILY